MKASLLNTTRGRSAKEKFGMKEAAYILDDLRSRNSVLYLQEVPKDKVSHLRLGTACPGDGLASPLFVPTIVLL